MSDAVGAIRLSGVLSNTITLIGDARLGGGNFTSGGVPIYGKITGPFNLDLGATGNSGGSLNGSMLFNQDNDWTGNTTIVGRTGNANGSTRVMLGTNDVIPDGFGKGNVQFGNTGNTLSLCVLDLNGFNETINGLVSIAPTDARALVFIRNSGASASTLTVGNNDQSGTYNGVIENVTSPIFITKIGGGTLTLTTNCTYTGDTTISNGAIALTGNGVLSGSATIRIESGATFDVSGKPTSSLFSTANTVEIKAGGNLTGNSSTNGIATLTTTGGQLTLSIHPTTTNIYATSLTTGGAANFVNISALQGVTALSHPVHHS